MSEVFIYLPFMPMITSVTLVSAILVFVVWKNGNRKQSNLLIALGFFCIGFGTLVLSFPALRSFKYVGLLANSSILCGLWTIVFGTRSLANLRGPGLKRISLMIISIVAVFVVFVLGAKFNVRMIVLDVSYSIVCITIVSSMFEPGAKTAGKNRYYIALGGIAIQIGIALRLLSSVGVISRYEIVNAMGFIFACLALIAGVLILIGVILINQFYHEQELENEVKQKKREIEKAKISAQETENLRAIILHELGRPINAAFALAQFDSLPTKNNITSDREDFSYIAEHLRSASSTLEVLADFDSIKELWSNPTFELITVETIAMEINKKWNVTIKIEPEVSRCAVHCDIFLIHVALDNLIENAYKYGTELKYLSFWTDQNYIFIDVCDVGSGISTGYEKAVWDLFSRGPDRSHAQSGSGIGMFVVKKIVEAHNGHASVFSQSPSIIQISLPLVSEQSCAR